MISKPRVYIFLFLFCASMCLPDFDLVRPRNPCYIPLVSLIKRHHNVYLRHLNASRPCTIPQSRTSSFDNCVVPLLAFLATSRPWDRQNTDPKQIEKLFDIACCLTDVVACIPFSPETSSHGPRDYVSRFLSLFAALRDGQTRYLPLLVAKVSEVLPDLPLPRSLNVSQDVSPSAMGMSPGGLGAVPSNVHDEMSRIPVSSPSYPSTDL